jgi:hypothetical protein
MIFHLVNFVHTVRQGSLFNHPNATAYGTVFWSENQVILMMT